MDKIDFTPVLDDILINVSTVSFSELPLSGKRVTAPVLEKARQVLVKIDASIHDVGYDIRGVPLCDYLTVKHADSIACYWVNAHPQDNHVFMSCHDPDDNIFLKLTFSSEVVIRS